MSPMRYRIYFNPMVGATVTCAVAVSQALSND